MANATKAKTNSTTATYEAVTKMFIQGLEQGIVGWKKPFFGVGYGNPITGSMYRGFNPLMLSTHNEIYQHSSSLFVTFAQVKDLCKTDFLKKGSKGCPLVYYNRISKGLVDENNRPILDSNGNQKKSFGILKYFTVFNIDCLTDNAKAHVLSVSKIKLDTKENIQNIQNVTAESIIDNWLTKPLIKQSTGNKAFYSPQFDFIQVPTINNHVGANEYYSTLFHESIHATGHCTRLNRDGIVKFDKFGSHQYSYEELIAEIGSAMLCHHTGIEDKDLQENQQAYINSWISKLESNPTWIYKAAKEAHKAFEHILNLDANEDEDEN